MANRKKKKSRANYGDGCMRFDEKRNQFVFTVRYEDIFGQKKRKSFYGKSEDICKAKRDEFFETLKIKNSNDDELKYLTIPEIVRRNLEHKFKQHNTEEQGYQRELDTLKIIESHTGLSSLPAYQIKKKHTDEFFESGICDKYAQSTLDKVCAQLRKALDSAVGKDNFMRDNQFSKPKSSIPTKEINALTIEQTNALIAVLNEPAKNKNGEKHKLPIQIALFTGLRMGEVLALKKSDIDIENHKLNVSKTISRGLDNRMFLKESTKTKNGIRTVPISKAAEPILKEALEIEVKNKEGLIFYNYYKDRVLTTQEINKRLKTFLKAADIPETYSTHCLRHTFASQCLHAKVDYATLSKWMGHSSIKITIDTYCDIYKESEDKALESLNESIGADYLGIKIA